MSSLKTNHNTQPEDSLESSMSMVASAIADPSRVSILCALMDGRAWTATELSAVAGIAASTASGHLNRLLENRLIICLAQGRHRYYRLAGHHIAGLLENLMGVSMRSLTSPQSRTPIHLRYARTCYDHLAGELAVEIYTSMVQRKWLIDEGTTLTSIGKAQLENLGAVLNDNTRRKFCCQCLDWSERRFHLGGEVGSALMKLFLQKEWISCTQGYREVCVTSKGKININRQFNLNLA